MFEDRYVRYDGEKRVRLVNFSRVLMYFTAVWIQLPLITYDMMIVITPLLLGFWDLIMGIWSNKPSTRFWNISFLVPFASIIVATNTIMHLLVSIPFSLHQRIMFYLSIGVILVSLFEINTLQKMARLWVQKIEENASIDEIRTYEV